MKKLINLFFAAAMMFGVVFIGDAISSNGNLSVQAQQTVTVRKRRKGVVRKTYGGGKYVVRKTYGGGKYVVRKTVKGTRYVSHKTKVATKYTVRKTYKGGRKVVSRTKKIIY